MAEITVLTPEVKDKFSLEYGVATATTLSAEDTIVDAFANKDNTLCLVFTAGGTVKILKGDMYPNKIKGDATVTLAGPGVVYITDKSRFQNRDGSVKLAKVSGSPVMFATARRAGYLDKASADAIDTANGRTLYM